MMGSHNRIRLATDTVLSARFVTGQFVDVEHKGAIGLVEWVAATMDPKMCCPQRTNHPGPRGKRFAQERT